ncbi:MAG TPA: IclR family transcriptional regulator [Actinomycetaceae bacterium]|nr:IclR family transcriptional regulator [Actinomycetaceae bacterium]
MQSAGRALQLIQLLGQRGEVTLTEVARELDISPSMAHRLLVTGCELDFVHQAQPGAPYGLGLALKELSLSASSAITLRDAGATQLATAAKKLRETLSVVVLEGHQIRYVETIEGDRAVRVAAPIGQLLPAHASAGGRAILSRLSTTELQRRFPARRLPPTPNASRPSWEELLEDLRRVRRRGWALHVGDDNDDVAAVGQPVLDGLGHPRAAVVISVPRSRLRAFHQAQALVDSLKPYLDTFQRQLRGSD